MKAIEIHDAIGMTLTFVTRIESQLSDEMQGMVFEIVTSKDVCQQTLDALVYKHDWLPEADTHLAELNTRYNQVARLWLDSSRLLRILRALHEGTKGD